MFQLEKKEDEYFLSYSLPRVSVLVRHFDKSGNAFLSKWLQDPSNRDYATSAATDGTHIHKLLEKSLPDLSDLDPKIRVRYEKHNRVLERMDFYCQEVPVFQLLPPTSLMGYAGTADCYGVINPSNVFSKEFCEQQNLGDSIGVIVDWKNPTKLKRVHKYVVHYLLQLAAYGYAYNNMFIGTDQCPKRIEAGLLSMASEDDYCLWFLPNKVLKWYYEQFIRIVRAYFNKDNFDWEEFLFDSNNYRLIEVQIFET